jgi:hypothetical protein
VAQDDDGIDAHGALRGDEAGEEGYHAQDGDDEEAATQQRNAGRLKIVVIDHTKFDERRFVWRISLPFSCHGSFLATDYTDNTDQNCFCLSVLSVFICGLLNFHHYKSEVIIK